MKKIKFKDKVFKQAIKDLFDLDDNMTLEDLEKIEEIIFYYSKRYSDEEVKYVNLNGKIKSLEDLKYFPNLKNLSLNFSDPENPEIYGDLKDIVHLTKLKILNMSGSIINGDLKLLKPLKDLEELTLTGVKIKGNLKELVDLPKLKKINMCDAKIKVSILCWTDIKGNLKDFKVFKDLEVLDLSECINIKGNIKDLKDLTKLEDIALYECSDGDTYNIEGDISSLGNLINLRCLDLSGTDVGGDPRTIMNLPNLKEVDLTYTAVEASDEIMEELEKENKLGIIKIEEEYDDDEYDEETINKANVNYEELRYSEKDLDILEKYRTENFGEFENVFHEIVSDKLHIDVYVSNPTKERDYYILMTEGMGAYKMDTPEGLSSASRAELFLYLPSNWKLDFKDENENNYWPMRWLKILSRMPLEDETWFGNYHTIGNGNDEEGFADKDKFVALFLLPFINMKNKEIEGKVVELANGEKLNFLQVVPLYNEELEYRIKRGGYYLLKEAFYKFDKKDFFIVDINRENIFESDKFIDFEKYKDSRIELKNPEQVIKFKDKGFEEVVRKLYKLEGEIKHKDIGYRESLSIVEYLRNGSVDIEKIKMETKIQSFKDLKWFVNLLELGLNHGDPGYPYIFGNLKDILCLKRLVALNISGAIVQGNLSDLKALPNLKEIVITGQGIKGKLSDLKDFEDLRILYVCDTRATGDLKDIKHLTKLEEIIVPYSKFTGDIKELENITNLKEISIVDTKIKGDIKSFSNLVNLQEISFYGNENIKGNIKSLSNLVNLEDLDISSSLIKGNIESLKKCNKLRALDISDTEIKGNIDFLLNFKCLHNLNIMDSNITYTAQVLDTLYKSTDIDIINNAQDENLDNYNSDDDKSDSILHRKTSKGLEYFEIYTLEDENNKGIIHYGIVGSKGSEEEFNWDIETVKNIISQKQREGFYFAGNDLVELKILFTDFPRVNPEALAMNVDNILSEFGIGFVTDDEVEDDILVVIAQVIDVEIAQKILVKELFEYGISFDSEDSVVFN